MIEVIVGEAERLQLFENRDFVHLDTTTRHAVVPLDTFTEA